MLPIIGTEIMRNWKRTMDLTICAALSLSIPDFVWKGAKTYADCTADSLLPIKKRDLIRSQQGFEL